MIWAHFNKQVIKPDSKHLDKLMENLTTVPYNSSLAQTYIYGLLLNFPSICPNAWNLA